VAAAVGETSVKRAHRPRRRATLARDCRGDGAFHRLAVAFRPEPLLARRSSDVLALVAWPEVVASPEVLEIPRGGGVSAADSDLRDDELPASRDPAGTLARAPAQPARPVEPAAPVVPSSEAAPESQVVPNRLRRQLEGSLARVRSLTRRLGTALAMAALLAVALIGYAFLISPKRSAAANLEERVESTQAQIEARRASARLEPAPTIDVAQLFAATRAMPDDARMPELVLELVRLATASGVSLQAITPQAEVARDGYRILPITLVADGKYFTLSELLARIRRLVRMDGGKLNAGGRLLAVESIAFGEGTRGFPGIRATLTVTAFVYGAGARSAGEGS
jgi:Tfp pilus assembly protein PilO